MCIAFLTAHSQSRGPWFEDDKQYSTGGGGALVSNCVVLSKIDDALQQRNIQTVLTWTLPFTRDVFWANKTFGRDYPSYWRIMTMDMLHTVLFKGFRGQIMRI